MRPRVDVNRRMTAIASCSLRMVTAGSVRPAGLSGSCGSPAHLAHGDFNGDGKTDLICTADDGNHVFVFEIQDSAFAVVERNYAGLEKLIAWNRFLRLCFRQENVSNF